MPQNCTLYCLADNPEQLIKQVTQLAQDQQFDIEGEENSWLAFRYLSEQTCMITNRMTKEDGDESFLKLTANTVSFICAIEHDTKNTQAEENQADLIKHINQSTQVLAVEVDNDFDEISEEILFSIAKISQGIIFTGNEFLNDEGGLILDIDGHSDEGLVASDCQLK